jgi:eukaryotic-like serine/threonine-protein kinase
MLESLETNTTISHYRIISKIGAGGMGEVYLAEDTRLDRKAALKILPPDFAQDSERMRRFVQEAKAASALNHPNIITIYEIGESEGTHYIAMEFIEGETLQTNLKNQSLDLKSTLETAVQVVSALDAAHRAGIVHRDIKPENVMIRADGLVKILDFGIAKLSASPAVASRSSEDATAIKPHSTSPGMIIGTANYMSPEQAKGKEIDARSDIFSFGIVLYEMLSGKRAFAGENALDVIGAILHKEPTPLNQILPALPHDIERIVNKTLRKDRDERYQTARGLLTDLKDARAELEFQDKLERTSAPNREEPKTQMMTAPTMEEPQLATSSAEFITGEIKRHKFRVALASLIVLASLGVGVWFFLLRSSSVKQIESIAVLPFENASGNADVEYLSDGMTETLISSLSQLPNLNVKARSSVFRYKGKETNAQTIGKELNVQAILNGRLIQRGDDLILYLELVDADTGNRIWGDQYAKKLTNLVSLQNEIARDVSQKLKTTLSGADEQKVAKNYTQNAEAYRLYLQGRFYWNKRTIKDLQTAIEYFRRAVELDSSYALAYAGLADAYFQLSVYGGAPPREAAPKAKEAVLKALSLDENLAEAHAALGQILNNYEYDFAGAEREYLRAIELNPNYATAHQWYGETLSAVGRRDEAYGAFRRGLELDPLSLIINRMYGMSLFYFRQYDESINQLEQTVKLDPGFQSGHFGLANVYQITGNSADSVEEYAKSEELGGRPEVAALIRESYAKNGWRGFLKTMTEEGRLRNSPHYNAARFYAALGEKDRAIKELNTAYENRETNIMWLKADPLVDQLRPDPRFQELLRKVGFPE